MALTAHPYDLLATRSPNDGFIRLVLGAGHQSVVYAKPEPHPSDAFIMFVKGAETNCVSKSAITGVHVSSYRLGERDVVRATVSFVGHDSCSGRYFDVELINGETADTNLCMRVADRVRSNKFSIIVYTIN
jgi:hypothetical protein